ncbi:MAG: hydrogenase maturation protease [Magnetococcus sp. DMHC-1]|nr:hydrogenase maturation protease [Magnetococcales bacterium]
MDTLIIGVGNRLLESDALGCLVYDWLARHPLPPGVAILDGGLRGIDLLPLLEFRQRVLFADAMTADVGEGVQCLDGAMVAASATTFGHGAGLPFLLAMLPKVSPPPHPVCHVVGACGPPTPTLVEVVALTCLKMVCHEPL